MASTDGPLVELLRTMIAEVTKVGNFDPDSTHNGRVGDIIMSIATLSWHRLKVLQHILKIMKDI